MRRQHLLSNIDWLTIILYLILVGFGWINIYAAGFNEENAKKILEIPEQMRLITLIIIGKHSKEINPVLSEAMKLGEKQRPPRISLEEFIYINDYGNKWN